MHGKLDSQTNSLKTLIRIVYLCWGESTPVLHVECCTPTGPRGGVGCCTPCWSWIQGRRSSCGRCVKSWVRGSSHPPHPGMQHGGPLAGSVSVGGGGGVLEGGGQPRQLHVANSHTMYLYMYIHFHMYNKECTKLRQYRGGGGGEGGGVPSRPRGF